MNVTDLCKSRNLSSSRITTPLLVPSFSSRGFPFLTEIHKALTPHISRVCLVSAFDIANDHIRADDVYASDILFVDSGGYEAKPEYDPVEAYHDQRMASEWSMEMYREVLSQLRANSEIVIVSYDGVESLPLRQQIDAAVGLFGRYPSFSGDFLWKPEPGSRFYGDPGDLVACLPELSAARCVGVTDKELGPSLVDRCTSIAGLRTALGQIGSDLPIHVFGCLDPLCCVLFYLCGADVFDGLSWLRYVYLGNNAMYMQQASILASQARLKDEELVLSCWVENLSVLERIQRSLVKFSAGFDVDQLLLSPTECELLRRVLREAGLSTEGVM
jgi:hypothetical protein